MAHKARKLSSIQGVRFIAVGLLSTLLNYFLFVYFSWLSFPYWFSMAFGFMSGTLMGFFLNKNWTFNVVKYDLTQIYKYFVLYAFSLIFGLIALELLIEQFLINHYLSYFITIFLTANINFWGSKIGVFNASE